MLCLAAVIRTGEYFQLRRTDGIKITMLGGINSNASAIEQVLQAKGCGRSVSRLRDSLGFGALQVVSHVVYAGLDIRLVLYF